MSELDEWQGTSAESNSENANGGSRDGYHSSYGNRENSYGANGHERTQRPRFNRSERVAYSSSQADRGFRPAGFGGSNDDNATEQRRPSYGQRPSYNNNREQRSYGDNGYDGGERQNNGYRQQRSSYGQGGGYQSRGEGGYNNNGGNRGGYNNGGNRGGYNNGGNRGGYNNGGNRGGYNNGGNRGGYNNGGNRGGYNSGYNNNRGGYRQRTADYDPNAKYNMKKRIEYKEYLEDPDAPIRLNKYLANAGVCSRREADQFIQAGVVKVNGEIITELGSKVQRTDEVHFHDQLVSIEKKVYVLLNKPKDYVTTSDDPQQRKTVMDLVKNCCRERIYPVGRLDRNTTGVLLFTNDGDLSSKLTHPKYLKKKIYHVQLDKNCTAADMQKISEGITLEDGEIRADAISYASDTDKKQIGIEIHSGKNRIVRRIFESLGYKVCKLDRVMFAGLTKKGLKRGDWRFLTEQEVAMLHMGSFE
ncbi:MAG: rRNA pseudouridine synthase [Bacteroidaceae bacterium]|nr:rRNA pseudouridine synthase [Bacteroidaceae bacterium]